MTGSDLRRHPAFVVLVAAAAQILASYTPASHRNLIFSLKQTGMPLGGPAL